MFQRPIEYDTSTSECIRFSHIRFVWRRQVLSSAEQRRATSNRIIHLDLLSVVVCHKHVSILFIGSFSATTAKNQHSRPADARKQSSSFHVTHPCVCARASPKVPERSENMHAFIEVNQSARICVCASQEWKQSQANARATCIRICKSRGCFAI